MIVFRNSQLTSYTRSSPYFFYGGNYSAKFSRSLRIFGVRYEVVPILVDSHLLKEISHKTLSDTVPFDNLIMASWWDWKFYNGLKDRNLFQLSIYMCCSVYLHSFNSNKSILFKRKQNFSYKKIESVKNKGFSLIESPKRVDILK